MKKPIALVPGTALALVLLVGCSSDPSVSGLRDDVKFVPGRLETKTRPQYVSVCKPKNRTVSTGSGKSKGTRIEVYQDCTKIRQGTETYTEARPTKWCVELDDVNGDQGDDDHWFTVSQGVYDAASEAAEGSRIKFEPIRQGC